VLSSEDCVISQLELTDASLTSQGHSLIAQGVSNCRGLAKLNLQGNEFGNELSALKCMISGSFAHQALHELNLAGNQLGDKAISVITTHLKNSQSLKSLDLSNNSFGSCGVKRLFNALKLQVEKLQKLVLDANDLSYHKKHTLEGNEVCQFRKMNAALVEFLGKAKLKHLSLADCRLETVTFRAIGESLSTNQHLEVLNLSNNSIQTACFADFCKFITPSAKNKN
jgi:Ran GTPase-activating protein (RanGAP) involved in mRNA processing and transport